MPAIERLPVDAVKLTHPPGQVWFGGLDEQVVLVGHQDIGMERPAEHADHPGQEAEELLAVVLISYDGMTLIAAGGYVIKRPRELQAQGPCHRQRRIARIALKGKTLALTLNLGREKILPPSERLGAAIPDEPIGFPNHGLYQFGFYAFFKVRGIYRFAP
jgi:hypothetical protein